MRLTIGQKLTASFTALSVLFGIVSGIGYYGIQLLEDSMNYVTGPAWETADGTMNTMISLQQQIISMEELLKGQNVEEVFLQLDQAQEEKEVSLERLQNSSLVSQEQRNRLASLTSRYDQLRADLVQKFQAFSATDLELRAGFESFRSMMVEAEALGDAQVEELRNNPDQLTSWNLGLDERWSAADGGMESSIFLLERFYYYQLMLARPERIPELQGDFEESLTNLKDTMNEMATLPIFVNGTNSQGQRFAGLFQEKVREHEQVFRTAVQQLQAMNLALNAYIENTKTLSTLLHELESSGDAAVNQERDRAKELQAQVDMMMGVLFLLALVVTIVLGILLIRNITSLLMRMVNELSESSTQLSGAAEQISQSSTEVSTGASEQASSLEETSASIEEITSQVRENADNAAYVSTAVESVSSMIKQSDENTRLTAQFSSEARDAAQAGVKAMNAITSAMGDIRKGSDQITAIIEVIDSITHQTKMLATNAAIEAARAGEHGKGFAVVADEVSKLAENSKQAAKEIGSLIRESVSKSKEGGELALQGEQALQDILERNIKVSDLIDEVTASSSEQAQKIGEMERMIKGINSASSEQASGVEQVSIAINEMNTVTQTNASISEETAAAAEELSSQAQLLNELVAEISLHVGGASEHPSAPAVPSRPRERSTSLASTASTFREPNPARSPQKAAQLPAPKPKITKQVKAEEMIPMRDDFSEF